MTPLESARAEYTRVEREARRLLGRESYQWRLLTLARARRAYQVAVRREGERR